MSGAGSVMDPQNTMRGRDMSKVARGEQAPRPPHEYGTVSAAPPPSSVHPDPNLRRNNAPGGEGTEKEKEKEKAPSEEPRHCYATYVEYQRCVRDKGKDACHKLASRCSGLCPDEWIERWNQQRENGTFPQF